MAETKFAATLRAVGGIKGIHKCLNAGNTAPLLLVIEDAWRSGGEAMKEHALDTLAKEQAKESLEMYRGCRDLLLHLTIPAPPPVASAR